MILVFFTIKLCLTASQYINWELYEDTDYQMMNRNI